MPDLKVLDYDKVEKLKKTNAKPSLKFERTQDNAVKTTSPRNIALILQHDPQLKNVIRYNEFTEEIDVVKTVTLDLTHWGIAPVTLKKGQINDGVINDLALYMSIKPEYHANFKTNLISQVADSVARANSYNPIVDYFEKCLASWDHKQRLKHFFKKYLGVEETEASHMITELWFMGAVAKGYKPETKFDYVLDFAGGQGVGKTSLLRYIAPFNYYTDQFNSFTEKDDKAELKNALIVNDDEMTASNRASFEEIKKFITEQVFRYRPSYGRYILTFKKGFVMARTTNELQHLKDKSGDRRFLPLKCDPKLQEVHPVDNLKQDEIDQIWGEAVWLYKNTPEPFKLTKHQEEVLAEQRSHFLATSEVEDEIEDLLANKFKDRQFISNQEMHREIEFSLTRDLKPKEINTMRYIMSHKGFDVGVVGWDPKTKKHVRGFRRD